MFINVLKWPDRDRGTKSVQKSVKNSNCWKRQHVHMVLWRNIFSKQLFHPVCEFWIGFCKSFVIFGFFSSKCISFQMTFKCKIVGFMIRFELINYEAVSSPSHHHDQCRLISRLVTLSGSMQRIWIFSEFTFNSIETAFVSHIWVFIRA